MKHGFFMDVDSVLEMVGKRFLFSKLNKIYLLDPNDC